MSSRGNDFCLATILFVNGFIIWIEPSDDWEREFILSTHAAVKFFFKMCPKAHVENIGLDL